MKYQNYMKVFVFLAFFCSWSFMAQASIKVGDVAPNFSLKDQKGQTVTLSQFKGQKSVVLYFYPKDDTPGCTKEACSFRDQYDVFKKAGAEVIGVSSDDQASHEQFAAKYKLPFHILSDEKGELRKAYGVSSTLGLLPGRVTYVIDKAGIVRNSFSSQMFPQKHIDESLKILESLNKTPY